ncbi:MAG: hypothetical protein QM594_03160 [Niabella sp.]
MNKLLTGIGTAVLLIVLSNACQKRSENVKTEIRYGTYLKNELSIPVYVQNGFRYIWQEKDTVFISEKQVIQPGATIKYTLYPANLTGTTVPRTSVAEPANTLWITIGNKVKYHYNCYMFGNTDTRKQCDEDEVNFFNKQVNWTKINHPEKDSVSNIYTINAKDSLEAQ